MSDRLQRLKASAVDLLARLVALAIVTGVFYQFFFAEPTSRTVVINRELGISGRVTHCSHSRSYTCYLDSSRVPYSFDGFSNEQLAPTDALSYYLQPGDSVAKQPHATYVLLWRHHQLSRWQLVPMP
jgi:hypothetical protein